uniref:Uncharacterized protein n=1 Tax=Rhizophora mucronata TaxID=61149 RepID=A0A2P2PYR3_RHIMU
MIGNCSNLFGERNWKLLESGFCD